MVELSITQELPQTKMDSRFRGNDGNGRCAQPTPLFPVTLAKAGESGNPEPHEVTYGASIVVIFELCSGVRLD